MDFGPWILGAATLAVGSVISIGTTLIVEARKRRWSKEDEKEQTERALDQARRQQAHQRSVAAAGELLELLAQTQQLFRDNAITDLTGGPSGAEISTLTSKMRHLLVDVGDPEVRRRLELVIEAFEQVKAIMQVDGDNAYRIVWKVSSAARDAIGSIRRGEAPSDDSSTLDGYHSSVLDYWGPPDA